MALTSYSALKTAVASWLNRTDLTDTIDDFIDAAEAKMSRRLHDRQMVERVVYTDTDTETIALPEDFGGIVSLRVNDGYPTELIYVSPDQMDDTVRKASAGAGRPRYYSISGDVIILSPVPAASTDEDGYELRMRYRKRIPALSSTNATNWVLDRHPDLYLYACMEQGALFLRDWETAAQMAGRVEALIREAETDAIAQKLGANLQMQSPGVV